MENELEMKFEVSNAVEFTWNVLNCIRMYFEVNNFRLSSLPVKLTFISSNVSHENVLDA